MSKETNNGNWFLGALFLVFMTLKLTNHIDWSWWWVTSPLWIPLAICSGLPCGVLWPTRIQAKELTNE